MNVDLQKKLLIKVCRQCSHRGLQTGNGGNISVRISAETMLIKASNTSFFSAEKEDFILTDFKGQPVYSHGKPSKECLLHAYLYQIRPDIQAIVHCHSPWATAWSSTGQVLPTATYHSVLKLNGNIPTLDSSSYSVPESFFPLIGAELSKQPHIQGFLMKRHGQFAFSDSLENAMFHAELIEETAQIALLEALLKSRL